MEKTPIIEVEKLTYSYDAPVAALKDINLIINEGDFVGLIGPNGGGKSTLIKLILGILPLQKGSIKLFGKTLKQFKHWSCIGYVSQTASHFDRRFPATVEEIVAMGRVSSKGPFASLHLSDRDIIKNSLDEVGMLSFKDVPLHHLSGGQQQRVFIARALASNACLLVLDEPTIGVDLNAQEQFYALLQKLRETKKMTIIFVSHDIDVIASEATTFACINQELVYHGAPTNFIKEDYFEKLYGKNRRLILHGH